MGLQALRDERSARIPMESQQYVVVRLAVQCAAAGARYTNAGRDRGHDAHERRRTKHGDESAGGVR